MAGTRISIAATIALGIAFVAILLASALVNARVAADEFDQLALERAEFQARILAESAKDALENGSSTMRSLEELLRVLLSHSALEEALESSQIVRAARSESLINDSIVELALFTPEGEEVWRVPPRSSRPENYVDSILRLIQSPESTGLALVGGPRPEAHSVVLARGATDESGIRVGVIIAHVSIGEALALESVGTIPDIDAIRLDSTEGEPVLAHVLSETSNQALEWIQTPLSAADSAVSGIMGGTHRASVGSAAIASVQVPGFPMVATGFVDKSDDILRRNIRTAITGVTVTLLGIASTVMLVLIIRRSADRNTMMQSHMDELNSDVDELERRDGERDLLMREVHHRVKNNLFLISNVIEMTIAGGGPFTVETLRDVESRIAAIQQVHDSLYRETDPGDIVRIDTYLESLVETITSSLTGPDALRTAVDVDAVEMASRKAVTLGLLSTEIITNAIRHGVVDGGSIAITGRAQDSMLKIMYWNDGRPYDEGKPGLGTVLINALVAQLHGSLELDSSDGTCWTLTIELDQPDH